MNHTILTLAFLGMHLVVTPWKIIGWGGALCFTLRWVVQSVHRHRSGTAEMPTSFWWISLFGSGMTLSYFIFGKNDSVGILSNLFPVALSGYNLVLDWRQRMAHHRPSA